MSTNHSHSHTSAHVASGSRLSLRRRSALFLSQLARELDAEAVGPTSAELAATNRELRATRAQHVERDAKLIDYFERRLEEFNRSAKTVDSFRTNPWDGTGSAGQTIRSSQSDTTDQSEYLWLQHGRGPSGQSVTMTNQFSTMSNAQGG